MLKKILLVGLSALVFGGCAASLVPGHRKESLYQWHSGMPWQIHIADQYTVSLKCNEAIPGLGLFTYGCTVPKSREVWMIDSWVVSQHECRHLQQMDSGEDSATEWIQDITFRWLLDNLLFSLTWPFPAEEKPCGDDYVYGADPDSRWVRLPTVSQFSGGRPEGVEGPLTAQGNFYSKDDILGGEDE